MIPELEQRKYKTSLEHLVPPESDEVFKTKTPTTMGGYIKGTKERAMARAGTIRAINKPY